VPVPFLALCLGVLELAPVDRVDVVAEDRKSNRPSPGVAPATILKTLTLPVPPRTLGFTWS